MSLGKWDSSHNTKILAEQVRSGENPLADKLVLVRFQDDLASLLQHSVSSVAAAAYSRGLIPPDVKDAAVNPKAGHNKLCISNILEEIRKQIATDPTKLQVFIDRVMIPMGPSVQHLTNTLGELLLGIQDSRFRNLI